MEEKKTSIEIVKEKIDKRRELQEMIDNDIIPAQEIGELQGALLELNNDNIKNNKSSIDMRSRLHEVEIEAILGIDILVSLQVFPPSIVNLTGQKKRLNVSKDGKGREEIVRLVAGKMENDNRAGNTFSEGIRGMFTKRDK